MTLSFVVAHRVVAALWLASFGSAALAEQYDCVPAARCGCLLVIDGRQCATPGGAHFFHDLVDGAALEFRPAGEPRTALSRRARTNSFTPEPGSHWTETFDSPDAVIEIRYSPGESTCPKIGEDCEYFDVRARIVVRPERGEPVEFPATGTCGC